MNINKIDTHINISDVFTKPLAIDKFDKFIAYIMNTKAVAPLKTLIMSVLKLNAIRHRKL